MSGFGKPFLKELLRITPKVEIDHMNKKIVIKRSYLFSNITEAYFRIKHTDYSLEVE